MFSSPSMQMVMWGQVKLNMLSHLTRIPDHADDKQCLGLLGLTAFAVLRRGREILIRKIFGSRKVEWYVNKSNEGAIDFYRNVGANGLDYKAIYYLEIQLKICSKYIYDSSLRKIKIYYSPLINRDRKIHYSKKLKIRL